MYSVDPQILSRLYDDAVLLLSNLIATPSFSREEAATADIIQSFLIDKGVAPRRTINNVWATNKHFDPALPTLLLNSHHDTVKPNKDYINDPFSPLILDDRLHGLGSNDAGGCLVSLIAAFLHFYDREDLKYNLVIAASAEEEVSGINGVEHLLKELPLIDAAIVGEPTLMDMAIAEKGLLVIDCIAHGRSGHAARDEGENAIYKAMKDIEWFRSYSFEKVSPLLGPVKMSVTIVNAGTQHNVVPATCAFTVDIRINECYTHEEILAIIKEHVSCEVTPRSIRLRATSIPQTHPLVQAGLQLGKKCYGSATMSDKALMPFPALKMGPGDSARSHIADEYINLVEIKQGIKTYIQLLNTVL